MKILFINTYDNFGGAAIAAWRLSKGLKKYYSTRNIFIVGNKKSEESNVFATTPSKIHWGIERIIDRITNKLGLQYQWFPFSRKTILKISKETKPDIISLHNSHGGYFEISLLKKLSKIAPIVWTLHDMWCFTGHCTHAYDCQKWQKGCGDCPALEQYPKIGRDTTTFLWKQKEKIYKTANITIVTPSKWLAEEAKKNSLFKINKITHINNGINQEIFKPKNKKFCQYVLDIPKDTKVLMIGTDSIAKGKDIFFEVLKQINRQINGRMHILLVGSGGIDSLKKFSNFIVHYIGQFSSEIFMSICFNASDLFLLPTRADTLPNVLIESISCGTPCVTFDIGGCGEIIKNDISGALVKPFDIKEFSNKILGLLNDDILLNKLSINARNYAIENYNLKKMSENYYKLFKELIKRD